MRSVEDLFGLSCQTPESPFLLRRLQYDTIHIDLFLRRDYNPVFDSKKEKESLNSACLLEFLRFFLFYELW